MNAPDRTILVGLGNLLLQDDGIGCHAVQALAADPLPGVGLLEAGTAILHALSNLDGAERVVAIDALQADAPPGTIHLMDGRETRPPDRRSSLHAMGLAIALRVLAPSGRAPELIIVGVEPHTIAYGMELSPALRLALPEVIRVARALALDWDRRRCGAGDLLEELWGANALRPVA